MRIYNLTTAIFLLGIGACSSQEGSMSQENLAAKKSEALTAAASARAPEPVKMTVAPSALAASATKRAAAPTTLSAQQVKVLTSSPPITTSPDTAAPAAASPAAYTDPAQAAAASVGVLAELVASGPPDKRGFTSAPEALSSSVSDGMPVLFVRLDNLTSYKSGQDAKALLLDKQEVMYPITVAGDVRSSVTVQKRADGTWEAAKFGNAPVAQTSHSIRQSVLSKRSTDTGIMSLVEIPTVGALLLSHTEKGVLMVTPVYDIPGTSFTAGVTRTAAEVFGALQLIAAKVDLSVPN